MLSLGVASTVVRTWLRGGLEWPWVSPLRAQLPCDRTRHERRPMCRDLGKVSCQSQGKHRCKHPYPDKYPGKHPGKHPDERRTDLRRLSLTAPQLMARVIHHRRQLDRCLLSSRLAQPQVHIACDRFGGNVGQSGLGRWRSFSSASAREC